MGHRRVGATWFRRAADQNFALAQHNLGVCYAKGQGMAKDDAEAVKWLTKAAEQNDVEAQYNVGVCYRDGQGVAKNEVEAYKWSLLAAAQGDDQAKANASAREMMMSREQVAEGKRRAQEWIEQWKTRAPQNPVTDAAMAK